MEESRDQKIVQELTEKDAVTSLSVPSQKEGNVETHTEEVEFSSPTPVKMKEQSRVKSRKTLPEELPEKYRNLLELYDRMTSSFRLLALRKKTPTFRNISTQVEILAARKFLPMHLAQIKHILPEAVQIDKVLVHDEKTKCMKPDMKIGLLFDIVDDHCEESVFVALSNIFSSRLCDFYAAHPEEDTDVPEALLPDPFNQKSIKFEEGPTLKKLPVSCDTQISDSSSPFSPLFKRRFHQKAASASAMEKTDLLPPLKSDSAIIINEEDKQQKSLHDSSIIINEEDEQQKLLLDSHSESITPTKNASGKECVIMVETPVQSTPIRSISPNRSVLTCEDDSKATGGQTSTQSNSAAKKSLDFYFMMGEGSGNLRKETSVKLSDLVLLIHKIFQSVNFYPITKEELVQKIIMHSCELDDPIELDIQIQHLEKLVPDWFYKKLAPSGDLLYNVKKVSDLNSVCERITVV